MPDADDHPPGHPEDQAIDVIVLLGGRERPGRLTLTRLTAPAGPPWQLQLATGDQHWTGTGHHVFAAVRDLMADLDEDLARIGVNGARPNVWASGMLADMGDGKSVYLLPTAWTPERPPTVPTLAPAPLTEVGTLADQDRFQQAWAATIGQTPREQL